MADFTITLLGKTFDQDQVRAAFEVAVRAVRGAVDDLGGELVIDGVTYPAEDVTDEAAGADSEDLDEARDEPTLPREE